MVNEIEQRKKIKQTSSEKHFKEIASLFIDDSIIVPLDDQGYNQFKDFKEKAVGRNMDDRYDMLINRLDQDIRDHKQELRDRDSLIQREMQERELRYREEMTSMEARHQKKSEEIQDLFIEVTKEIKTELINQRTSINRVLSGYQTTLENIEKRMIDSEQNVRSMLNQNTWGRIGIIIAIITICVTVGATAWAAVYSLHNTSNINTSISAANQPK